MNAQQVPKGYRKTEVGIIPEDWDVATIGDLFHIKAGGDFDPTNSSLEQSQEYPFPVYANGLENQGLYGFTYCAQCKAGAVTVTARGTLGVAFYRDTPFTPIGRLLALNPKNQLDGRFFSEYINTFVHFAVESTGVPQLTAPQISHYWLPLPPLPEQRAIAAALADVDGLLDALDALIAKKRAIKTAAMQQLLTGKTRLPGFQVKPGYKRTEVGVIPEDWEVKTIGDVFSIQVGASKSQYISEHGKYWIVDMGSISPDGQLICSKSTNHAEDFLNTGALVMPKDDIGGGKIIGKVAHIPQSHKYILGDHVYALSLQVEGVPLFFSYLINRHETNLALKKKVAGSAQLGLSRQSVIEQRIPVPAIAEQRAIAAVLSDMDAEIAALEARREKVRQIKQGMMQVLLTGKVRLVAL